jgi:hypothetical protein
MKLSLITFGTLLGILEHTLDEIEIKEDFTRKDELVSKLAGSSTSLSDVKGRLQAVAAEAETELPSDITERLHALIAHPVLNPVVKPPAPLTGGLVPAAPGTGGTGAAPGGTIGLGHHDPAVGGSVQVPPPVSRPDNGEGTGVASEGQAPHAPLGNPAGAAGTTAPLATGGPAEGSEGSEG